MTKGGKKTITIRRQPGPETHRREKLGKRKASAEGEEEANPGKKSESISLSKRTDPTLLWRRKKKAHFQKERKREGGREGSP